MAYYSILAICILILALCVVNTIAIPQIEYHKNSTPLFTFNKSLLIESVDGSYSMGGQNYCGPLMNFEDTNLSIQYFMFGRKVAKDPPILTFGKEQYRDPKTGEWHFNNNSDSPIQEPQITPYETKLTGIDEFLTPQISQQITYSASYKIKNSNVNLLCPFIIKLGQWPKYINNININQMLDIPLDGNTKIYGENQILVINKDSDKFNFLMKKENFDYYLYVEKPIEGLESDSVQIFLRPIISNFDVQIEELNWGNFNEPISYRPRLVFNISDKNITSFIFTYNSAKGYTSENFDLNENDEIEFIRTVYPTGTKILYPFDKYSSEIEVYPPLLTRNNIDIGMPYGSNLVGKLETDNNKFTITIKRDIMDIIKYFALLFLCLIPIFFVLKYPQGQIFLIISVLLTVVQFYLNNNLKYPNSIGSLISIIVLIILAWMYYNYNNLFT